MWTEQQWNKLVFWATRARELRAMGCISSAERFEWRLQNAAADSRRVSWHA
jgi:hypothetical protein